METFINRQDYFARDEADVLPVLRAIESKLPGSVLGPWWYVSDLSLNTGTHTLDDEDALRFIAPERDVWIAGATLISGEQLVARLALCSQVISGVFFALTPGHARPNLQAMRQTVSTSYELRLPKEAGLGVHTWDVGDIYVLATGGQLLDNLVPLILSNPFAPERSRLLFELNHQGRYRTSGNVNVGQGPLSAQRTGNRLKFPRWGCRVSTGSLGPFELIHAVRGFAAANDASEVWEVSSLSINSATARVTGRKALERMFAAVCVVGSDRIEFPSNALLESLARIGEVHSGRFRRVQDGSASGSKSSRSYDLEFEVIDDLQIRLSATNPRVFASLVEALVRDGSCVELEKLRAGQPPAWWTA